MRLSRAGLWASGRSFPTCRRKGPQALPRGCSHHNPAGHELRSHFTDGGNKARSEETGHLWSTTSRIKSRRGSNAVLLPTAHVPLNHTMLLHDPSDCPGPKRPLRPWTAQVALTWGCSRQEPQQAPPLSPRTMAASSPDDRSSLGTVSGWWVLRGDALFARMSLGTNGRYDHAYVITCRGDEMR